MGVRKKADVIKSAFNTHLNGNNNNLEQKIFLKADTGNVHIRVLKKNDETTIIFTTNLHAPMLFEHCICIYLDIHISRCNV